MVVGFLWYSPILFAKAWVREMGYDVNDKARMDEMKKSAGRRISVLLLPVSCRLYLALFFHEMHVQSIEIALLVAFHVWLGFVATVQLTGVLFMKQSMKLFAINTGYQLVCYLVMGAIIASWK